MKCQNCHHNVTRKSKFCPNCGEKIAPRTSVKVENKRRNLPFGYALVLIAGGILIGYIIFNYSTKTNSRPIQPVSNFQGTIPIQSPAVLDIAKEFMCACGTCSDPLDVCNCDHPNGAIEVKRFIAQKLQEGHKKPHIVEMVQAKYGGLKADAAPPLNLNLPK